ncbi:hypothetical protein CI696_10335 [Shigella sonnei]|nr:hypothetical protein CI696_10335 [Shigella sonnei]
MLQKPSDHNASCRGKEGLSAVFVMKSRMIIFNPVNTFLSFFVEKMFITRCKDTLILRLL